VDAAAMAMATPARESAAAPMTMAASSPDMRRCYYVTLGSRKHQTSRAPIRPGALNALSSIVGRTVAGMIACAVDGRVRASTEHFIVHDDEGDETGGKQEAESDRKEICVQLERDSENQYG